MLNIGLWGAGPSKHVEFIKANRDLEHKLRELGGMKWLYAHTYYTEVEFWEIYDRSWYEALRQKYDATSLPSVYDKVKVGVGTEKGEPGSLFHSILDTWPVGGLYGIKKAIESRTYLQARSSSWKASREADK